MRKKIPSLLVAIAIGISLLNVISSDSASAADTRIITCTSLKSGVIYLAKTGKCNARIYESSIWYKEGTAPSGTPGSKIISLTICRSKSKPESIILRIKCNARTQIATIWQRPLGPPAAPSIVTITAGVLGTATVETKAPTENGGARITSLTLSANPTSVVGKTARASSTYSPNSSGVIEISGLTPGASYVFTLIANNAVGASAPSQASASFLAPTVPGPASLTAVATTGTNSALITYAAPSFDGGSPITSYTATSSPGGIQATVYRSTGGTIEMTGLAAATSYTFTIVANNFAGPSIRSSVSAPITTLTPPPATADAPAPSPTPTPTPTLATPAFTLTHTSETVIVDTAATGFTINSTGGTIASFAINATPAGMSFNTSTGALSGTPTSVAGATTYTITATNASGSASRTFALTVTAAKLTPTFSAWANLSKPAAGGDFVLKDPTVTGAIAGTFTYSSASTGVITLSSSTAHIVAAGTSVITATFTPTDTAAYFSASTTMTITVSSGDYIVGMDGPGGGKIFYVSTSTFACGPTLAATCKFLEVAPNTWSGGAADPSKIWAVVAKQSLDVSGITFDNAVNNTTSGIGLGYKNSIAIVTQGNDITTAAGAARAYSGGSKSDWYLPTSAELNQLCKWAGDLAWTSDATRCSGLTPVNGGFNSDKYYWSSSTKSEFHVWYQKFSSYQSYSAKSVANYVRPIRAFASTIISSRTLTIDSGSYTSSYTMTATPPILTSTPSAGVDDDKSYTSSTTGICTVGSSSGVVVFVSAGTCTISARILSDGDYEQVDSASISFTLSLASQTLTWAPTTVIFMTETPKTPSSLASALGSPTITYSVTSAGTTGCTVNSSTAVLTFTAVGSCNVRATSSVTSVYESATKDVTFSITLATRTLSIDSGSYTSSYTMTATPPTLTSTPSVGSGSKSYSSSTTGVCTVGSSNGIVVFVSAGTCTISAVIASDGTYDTSTSAGISFSVTKTPTSLALFTNMNKTLGDPSFTLTQPSVSPSITGTFTYTSSDILTASISGSTVTIVAPGSTTITATFTPDNSTTYSSSTTTAILTIKLTPTFSAWANVSKYVTDSDFTISSPTANGGVTGTYSYFSATTGVISLTGTSANAHVVAEGTSVITATFTPTDTSFYNVATTTMTITVFRIGSIGPGGGKIFYHSVDGFDCGSGFTSTGSPTGGKCHYLEVAISATSPAWTDATYAWSGNTNTSIGTTSTAIGSGYKNTLAMISQNNTINKAGTIVREYSGGGFTDWYLPSKDELNQLYSARTQVGGLGGLYYWSSSEDSSGNSWLQDFSNSFNQSASSKTGSNTVRPVRAF